MDTIDKHWQRLESNLNLIFEHIHESKSCDDKDFIGRRDDIERLTREAKQDFDWIDNNTSIKPA